MCIRLCSHFAGEDPKIDRKKMKNCTVFHGCRPVLSHYAYSCGSVQFGSRHVKIKVQLGPGLASPRSYGSADGTDQNRTEPKENCDSVFLGCTFFRISLDLVWVYFQGPDSRFFRSGSSHGSVRFGPNLVPLGTVNLSDSIIYALLFGLSDPPEPNGTEPNRIEGPYTALKNGLNALPFALDCDSSLTGDCIYHNESASNAQAFIPRILCTGTCRSNAYLPLYLAILSTLQQLTTSRVRRLVVGVPGVHTKVQAIGANLKVIWTQLLLLLCKLRDTRGRLPQHRHCGRAEHRLLKMAKSRNPNTL